jgi:hypothetical protein
MFGAGVSKFMFKLDSELEERNRVKTVQYLSWGWSIKSKQWMTPPPATATRSVYVCMVRLGWLSESNGEKLLNSLNSNESGQKGMRGEGGENTAKLMLRFASDNRAQYFRLRALPSVVHTAVDFLSLPFLFVGKPHENVRFGHRTWWYPHWSVGCGSDSDKRVKDVCPVPVLWYFWCYLRSISWFWTPINYVYNFVGNWHATMAEIGDTLNDSVCGGLTQSWEPLSRWLG